MNRVISGIDGLNRVVIPKKFIKELGIKSNIDFVYLTLENNKIIISNIEPICCFCGAENSLRQFKNGFVCLDCTEKLKKS